MQEYNIVYYTGYSSLGLEAIALLKGEYLVIKYIDNVGEPVSVEWKINSVRKHQTSGRTQSFQYGSFPYQTIETSDEELIAVLSRRANAFSRLYHTIIDSSLGILLVLGALFLAFVASIYFWVLPFAAEHVAGLIPQHYEVELGDQLMEAMVDDYQKDDTLSKLANDFATHINFQTDYPIRVTVVKQNELNAFALPGGNIVIYDKLLKKLQAPEELAALLAHEVAHIKYQHSLKSISRSLAAYVCVSLFLGDISGVGAVLIENADMLHRMSYSRDLEQEADKDGLTTLSLNKLDQQGMVKLLKALEEEGENNLLNVSFLSTHPLTTQRIAFAQEEAANQEQTKENKQLLLLWNSIEKVAQDK